MLRQMAKADLTLGQAAKELGLAEGVSATATVKATSVMIEAS